MDKQEKNISSSGAGLGADLPATTAELFQLDQYPIFDEKDGIEKAESEELLRELLVMTLDQLFPAEIANLEKAHAEGDWDKLQKIAHKLKGGSVYCGIIRMTYACKYLERYWKAGHRELLEELYQQMLAVIKQTQQTIQVWLNR